MLSFNNKSTCVVFLFLLILVFVLNTFSYILLVVNVVFRTQTTEISLKEDTFISTLRAEHSMSHNNSLENNVARAISLCLQQNKLIKISKILLILSVWTNQMLKVFPVRGIPVYNFAMKPGVNSRPTLHGNVSFTKWRLLRKLFLGWKCLKTQGKQTLYKMVGQLIVIYIMNYYNIFEFINLLVYLVLMFSQRQATFFPNVQLVLILK